jgi:phage tail-like protein
MRGSTTILPTPKPLAELLPAVLQEDAFVGRFTAGLDDVLSPVFSILDCLDAYVDPAVCPADYLDWLAGWVGLVLDENWPVDRRRTLTSRAVGLYRTRGTAEALRAEVEVFTGGTVDVRDNGGTVVSDVPGAAFPDKEPPRIVVQVAVDDPASVNVKTLDALVAAAKPAHVLHEIEVIGVRRGRRT